MEILVVIPRYNLANKKDYEYAFPLGLGYISSIMKKAGYIVDCFNLNHHEGTVEEILNRVLDSKKYDIVCSGHIGIGYAVIEKIISTVHSHNSKPKFILGGTIITSAPKLIFNGLSPDYAVLGEGEVTIIELLDAIENKKDLNEVDGIIYRKNGELVITKPRKPIEDLDSLPYPDFESFGFNEQLDNMSSNTAFYIFDSPRVYPLLCSRGCPFQCTFCYHTVGLRYRTRSIDNVMEELREMIKKYRINVISIYDDLFSINKERLYEFCRKIKELLREIPWECKWSCQLSVQNVDKEMLDILKDAGCYIISYGFESYSLVVLKSMKKPITPEQIDRAIKLSMEEKIAIQGNFIFGDVAETKETAKETLDYWKNNCKGQLHLGFIQPYPGSEIYNHCIKKGIIKDELYFIKNQIANTNWFNMTDKMADKEVIELKKDILKARIKYGNYVMPLKVKKIKKNINRYNITAECPFCKETIVYPNCLINNRFLYILSACCKSCHMRFNIISRAYKLGTKHYQKLDFFRKNYLLLRDSMLKQKI